MKPASTTLPAPSFSLLLQALETTDKPLGDLCTALRAAPPLPPLPLGATLAALLQHDLLPDPAQRLVAIYILYDQIVSQPPPTPPVHRLLASPLTLILFDLVERGDARPPEQLFLSHLLSHSQSAADAPVPAQISKAAAVALWSALEGALQSGASVPKLNTTSLRQRWAQRHPPPPPPSAPRVASLTPVTAVVPCPDPQRSDARSLPLSVILREPPTLEDFVPRFARPAPPFLPLDGPLKELRWIDPEPLHEVIWDPDMGMKGERGSELRNLMAKAFKTPIPEAQQMKVLAQLEDDPKLVHLCGLTPQRLPDLVKNNSGLATEILLKLVSSNQMPQYFSALVSMEVNKHSMEVVNRLTSAVDLPADFVHTYISNCIASCAIIPDKFDQIRMVRLVCVFLKSLIKNKIIDVQELSIEVQAFCIEYSRIREVADLFRSLKNYGV